MRPQELVLEEPAADDVTALVRDRARARIRHPWAEASLREAVLRKDRFEGRGCAIPPRGERRSGASAAYCIVQRVADELQIHNLAVHPNPGAAAWRVAFSKTASSGPGGSGARTRWLEVRQSNHAALALYAGAGFEQRGAPPRVLRRPSRGRAVLGWLGSNS